jgi:hypothetical protein
VTTDPGEEVCPCCAQAPADPVDPAGLCVDCQDLCAHLPDDYGCARR